MTNRKAENRVVRAAFNYTKGMQTSNGCRCKQCVLIRACAALAKIEAKETKRGRKA